jgi:hypothetical protein
MLISDPHQFIFVHNPKAAGTTVRTVLTRYDSTGGMFWRRMDNRLPQRDMAHIPLEHLQTHYPDEFAKFGTYFVFGFVREPLARFVSGFNETHKPLYQRLAADSAHLEEYRATLRAYARRLLAAPNDRCPYVHVSPQHRFFYLGKKLKADLVIKVESPTYRLMALEQMLGAPGRVLKEAMLNQRKRRNTKPVDRPIADLLDADVHAGLVEYYRMDYLLFEYDAPVA